MSLSICSVTFATFSIDRIPLDCTLLPLLGSLTSKLEIESRSHFSLSTACFHLRDLCVFLPGKFSERRNVSCTSHFNCVMCGNYTSIVKCHLSCPLPHVTFFVHCDASPYLSIGKCCRSCPLPLATLFATTRRLSCPLLHVTLLVHCQLSS